MTHQQQIQKQKAPAQASSKARFKSKKQDTTTTTKNDSRFSVNPEFCGYATAQFVARFCGEWIGCAATQAQARELADKFNANRF